ISSHNLGLCANGDKNKFFKIGKALINNIKQLERMGKNCARFAMNIFCNEKIIDTYIDIFKNL
ncbi:MAG: hypothetical protein ACTSWE_03605, partial [Promethearchaeota archaeon]